MEIRLENGKNTANTLGAFFWSFFLDFTNFTSFFPGGLIKGTSLGKMVARNVLVTVATRNN